MPLPPSASLQDLAGEYYGAGYGRMTFKSAGENERSLVLVAERPEMAQRYNVRLQHVSGDGWVAYMDTFEHSIPGAIARKATFKTDSKVSALVIDMGNYNVTFAKVA